MTDPVRANAAPAEAARKRPYFIWWDEDEMKRFFLNLAEELMAKPNPEGPHG